MGNEGRQASHGITCSWLAKREGRQEGRTGGKEGARESEGRGWQEEGVREVRALGEATFQDTVMAMSAEGRCSGERLNLRLSFALILAMFSVW